MIRTRWAVSALASFVMVGAVTLASPGGASAATWQVTPAQAWVVPDSATDAWGSIMNFPYDGTPDTTDVVHLSGTTWNNLTVPGLPGDTSAAVAGDSPTDAWAVWARTAAHNDGSSWTTYTFPVSLSSVAIVSPTSVWAAGPSSAGETGMILNHWDGAEWSQVTAPSPAGYPYAGVVPDGLSVSGGDLWVLASANVGPPNYTGYFAARWDGTSWSTTALPVTPGQQAGSISAASATDVWVSGYDSTGGFAMHYNGSAWSTFRMPAAAHWSNAISSIAARGDQAWAAGTSSQFYSEPYSNSVSALWHWDGSTWSSVAFPVDNIFGRATVNYVPGSNTVWVEAIDPSVSGGMVIAAGG